MWRTSTVLLLSFYVIATLGSVAASSPITESLQPLPPVVVNFRSCNPDTVPPPPLRHSIITWSSKDDGDSSTSVLEYKVCAERSQDLRFVTHLRLEHWNAGQPVMDRVLAICDGTDVKRQACIDQLAQSNTSCLTGSVIVRSPAFANSPDGKTHSLVSVFEGATDSIAHFCSV